MPRALSIIPETLRIYWRHRGLILGYTGWLLVPIVATLLLSLILPAQTTLILRYALNGIVYLILSAWASTVITLLVDETLRGKETISPDLGTKAWPLAGIYLFTSIIVMIFLVSGFVLFIIPFIFFLGWFVLAPTAAVIHRFSPFKALAHTRNLAKGRVLNIAGTYLICTLFFGVIYFGGIILITGSQYLFDPSAILANLQTPPDMLTDVLYRVLDILMLPLITIFPTLIYLRLSDS